MTETRNAKKIRIVYVGDARGQQARTRRVLEDKYGPCTVRFEQCQDYEAGTEIARTGHAWAKTGAKIITFNDIREEWSWSW